MEGLPGRLSYIESLSLMTSIQNRIVNTVLNTLNLRRVWSDIRTAADKEDADAVDHAVKRARNLLDHRRPPAHIHRSAELFIDSVDGFPLYLMHPKDGESDNVILYLHGGAYVIGPSGQHWSVARNLLERSGHAITLLDYPKAPEYNCERAMTVASMAYQRLLEEFDPDAVTLMGDSAGGGLALALAGRIKETGLPRPRQLILMSPWLDIALTHDEITSYEDVDRILSPAGLKVCGEYYAHGLSAENPCVSPKYGDLEGLPPIHIFYGTKEIFYPDIRDFQEEATAKGHDVRGYLAEGMPHVYFLFPFEEAETVVSKITNILE